MLGSMGATEDDAWRRLVAGQKPVNVAGRSTNHALRLYTAAVALVVFFVAWAAIAANPWKKSSSSGSASALAALTVREQRVQQEAALVQQIVSRRFKTYRAQVANRQRILATQPVAAPAVRVVTLPPLTITKTS